MTDLNKVTPSASISGHAASFATAESTKKYTARFLSRAAQGHFREQHGLQLSSMGIGTYLGEPDSPTDRA